jgi:hypothetical protein
MQSENKTGNIPQHDYNPEHRLHNNDIPGTDRGGPYQEMDLNSYAQMMTALLGTSSERQTLLTTHPLPPIKTLPFHPLMTHTRHKRHPLSLSFSTKRVLSLSPSPDKEKDPHSLVSTTATTFISS